MARIFLCLANAVCFRFGRTRYTTGIAYLRLLAVVVLLSSIDMRMSWSERGVGLSLGFQSSMKTDSLPFVLHLPPVKPKNTLFLLDTVVLRTCLFFFFVLGFLRNFCVAPTSTPERTQTALS
ncbi:hypothetical protein BDM02DRAFT_3119506 [Thelephora ganbajun]|uniref:Uncharacterized protein n=1 Tax=Thelephora ganbajun TaxID=370292 RepID=A0ACB6Z8K4_THEGA|nr:hypothetical protein BDM02DRAFT_3119506 [Thelephora ganbajun]